MSVYSYKQVIKTKKSKKMNDTKVLSARVPLAFYVDIIHRAQQSKLSISDYITASLFQDEETLLEREELVEQLRNDKQELEEEVKQSIKIQRDNAVELARLKTEKAQLKDTLKKFEQYHNSFVESMSEMMTNFAKNSFLADYSKEKEFIHQHRWNIDLTDV